jgi:outer membrane receptor for ferrienterochelin and colicin
LRQFFTLYFSFFFATFYTFGQIRPDQKRITYSAYNKPLKTVLTDISRLSGANLVYSESRIPSRALISINAKNEAVGDILTAVLKPYSFSYKLVGNQLVLVKEDKRKPLLKDAILYGYVKDIETGEALIGASVFVQDKSQSTVTNEYGFFSMKVARETQRIYFEYIGYKTATKEFFVRTDSTLVVGLDPGSLLNEVVIIDKITEDKHENTGSQHSLHRDKILVSNHLMGEPDVFRYLANLPGVNTGSDGTGGLNVRGGSSDQNLVLLDGVPVYNTGHALGIFSVFNGNAVKSVNFYNGGIPARYAGRLSSVIDIYTKDGNYKKLSGDFNLSLIAASGTLEGPIRKDKSSFFISFRRTHLDVLIKNFTRYQNQQRGRDGFSNYYFSDLNVKLNFAVGKKSRLLVSGLMSEDRFGSQSEIANTATQYDQNEQNLRWGNALGSIRFNSELGKNLYSRFTLYATQYQFETYRKNRFEIYRATDTTFVFDASLFDSSIREYGIKQDWDWIPNSNNSVKLGVYALRRQFEPRVTSVDQSSFNSPNLDINIDQIKAVDKPDRLIGDEVNAYIEDEVNLGSGIKANFGINYTLFFSKDKSGKTKTYNSLQPRFSLLASSENVHFKVGASRMHQNLHILTNDGLGLPTDVWIPVSNIVSPQKSWLFNAAFGYRSDGGYRFGTDVYYKKFEDISTFKAGGGLDINAASNWQSQVPIGNGTAYGVEVYVEKEIGSNIFSTNYTYSISDRLFPDVNTNRAYSFGYNRVHNFKCSYVFRLSKFSEFLINWTFQSGTSYSLPINATINPNGLPVVIYKDKNNATFPDYHRLDVGFTFYNERPWGRSKLFLGLFNAYNRTNPFYTELVRDSKQNGRFYFNQYSLPALLPTLSYGVAF